MFQNTERYTIPYPELAPISNLIRISFEEQKLIENLVEEQYTNLNTLGIDYIGDKFVDPAIYQNLVMFFHDNYVPIVHVEVITDNDDNTILFGKIIYLFLVIDLMKTIIPNGLSLYKFKTCTDAVSLDYEKWREVLLQSVHNRIELLTTIRQISENTETGFEHFKYTYYLDLLDNDISNLVESFIIPMINKYQVEIDSNMP